MIPAIIVHCLLGLAELYAIGAPKNACVMASEKLTAEQAAVEELRQLLTELEARFEKYCKEDFSAQVEGLANELHRNKAIKVAFAKRRLIKLIDNKSRDIASALEQYCGRCRRHVALTEMKQDYCNRCPDSCQKAK